MAGNARLLPSGSAVRVAILDRLLPPSARQWRQRRRPRPAARPARARAVAGPGRRRGAARRYGYGDPPLCRLHGASGARHRALGIFTHAFDAFDFSPRLAITSAEKRSGKTRLVEVLERIVDKPLFVSGITPAALLRVIEQRAPCMLLDEIDTMMKVTRKLRAALRGLINSGFDRAGARFIKNVPTPGAAGL